MTPPRAAAWRRFVTPGAPGTSGAPTDFTLRTWRYLRVATVAMVVGLFWSVGYEVVHNPRHCWQTSLSAYWYTPAQAIFVGTLVTIGVSLFSLKGRSPAEDALLTAAGVLAPVVAIVPVPTPGGCSTLASTAALRAAAVANTMQALFVVGTLLLLFVGALLLAPATRARFDPFARAGYGVAALVHVVAVVVFFAARSTFLQGAHYAAAIPMFAAITGVVALHAWRPAARAPRWRVLYSVVAAAMLGSAVVLGLLTWLLPWAHGIIALESALVGLFAVFWVAQTAEEWVQDRERSAPAGVSGRG